MADVYSSRSTSTIKAWAFYDWANSVYPLIITTVIFPLFYQELVKETYPHKNIVFLNYTLNADVLYSYVIAFVYLGITLISPLLSAIADLKHYKKTFLAFFCSIGSVGTMSLYWFNLNNLEMSFISIALGSFGFWIGLIFYNAYLPEIATKYSINQVSAYGYALGYVGSSLLLIFFLFALKSNWLNMRECFVVVGLWWFIFSLYPLKKLPGRIHFFSGLELFSEIKKGMWFFKEVFKKHLYDKKFRHFWIAYFFLSLGIQTIIILATFFAVEEINWKNQDVRQVMIILILLIQFIAALGAYIFAYLGKKIGNQTTLMITAFLWFLLCCLAYFVREPQHFYWLCTLEGLILGGSQSLARSTYVMMIKKNKIKEKNILFSIYGIVEKIGIVVGTFVFGFIHGLTNSMRFSIILLTLSFVLALIFLSSRFHRDTQRT